MRGQKEIYKALVAGEELTINTKYAMEHFLGGLPCICLTNNKNTLHHWSGSDDFKNQCFFVDVNFYLGPENTRPSFFRERQMLFSNKTEEDLKKMDEERKMNNENFKRPDVFQVLGRKRRY
jgi:hypothetical protein